MFVKALLAVLIVPGVFAGIIPLFIVDLDPWRSDSKTFGIIFIILGLIILLRCVRDFYVYGKGTLLPWIPTNHLVIIGLYRYTRNPMYLGILTLISGIALLFASPLLGIYTATFAIIFHLRTIYSEEPYLANKFNTQWIEYAQSVPRWIPRRTAWHN